MESADYFHFLRPYFLLLIVPLLVFVTVIYKRGSIETRLRQNIPAPLLELISRSPQQSRLIPSALLFAFGVISIFAIAGPTWQRSEVPSLKLDVNTVILLDTSTSMNASDVKPSRFIRAKLEIKSLIQKLDHNIALVAFSAHPHQVAPLTDDHETIENLLDSLDTGIMPEDGSNLDAALQKAQELLHEKANPHILLVSDFTAETGGNISLGTSYGDVPLSLLIVSEFAKVHVNGEDLVQDRHSLKALGKFSKTGMLYIQNSNEDTQSLQAALNNSMRISYQKYEKELSHWKEAGPWLMLVLLPLFLWRYSYRVSILILAIPLYAPAPAHALELWQTPDQKAYELFQKKQYKDAQEQFADPHWKATSAYRQGDYQSAEKYFSGNQDAQGHYNLGNSLAMQGKIQQAIKQYDEVLRQQPDHQKASYNRKLLQDYLDKQQQSNNDQQQNQDQENTSKDQNQQQNDSSQHAENAQQSGQPETQGGKQGERTEQGNKNGEQKTEQQSTPSQQHAQSDKNQDSNSDQNSKTLNRSEELNQRQLKAEDQFVQQWLRQIPDDPGGLLRRKFLLEKQRMEQQ